MVGLKDSTLALQGGTGSILGWESSTCHKVWAKKKVINKKQGAHFMKRE